MVTTHRDLGTPKILRPHPKAKKPEPPGRIRKQCRSSTREPLGLPSLPPSGRPLGFIAPSHAPALPNFSASSGRSWSKLASPAFSKELWRLKRWSVSSLLPFNLPGLPAPQPGQHLRPSQFWHPASVPVHTLTPFQGSTRPGATPQLGEGEGEGDGKIKAGQKETRVGPKILEPAPQLKGQGGRASGATTRGSGRRLFSRTGREATQVSANDLTHCKGGQLKDRAKAGLFLFQRPSPPSIPGKPPARIHLDSSFAGPQFP